MHIIIILLLIVVWIKTIIDIANGTFENKDAKIPWLLIVILIPFLGTIAYMLAGPKPIVNK